MGPALNSGFLSIKRLGVLLSTFKAPGDFNIVSQLYKNGDTEEVTQVYSSLSHIGFIKMRFADLSPQFPGIAVVFTIQIFLALISRCSRKVH